jgi:hypothetical protein
MTTQWNNYQIEKLNLNSEKTNDFLLQKLSDNIEVLRYWGKRAVAVTAIS